MCHGLREGLLTRDTGSLDQGTKSFLFLFLIGRSCFGCLVAKYVFVNSHFVNKLAAPEESLPYGAFGSGLLPAITARNMLFPSAPPDSHFPLVSHFLASPCCLRPAHLVQLLTAAAYPDSCTLNAPLAHSQNISLFLLSQRSCIFNPTEAFSLPTQSGHAVKAFSLKLDRIIPFAGLTRGKTGTNMFLKTIPCSATILTFY